MSSAAVSPGTVEARPTKYDLLDEEELKTPGTIYLLCLNKQFGHARHYIGWSRALKHRLKHHRRGTGAWFLRKVREAGISWKLVRTWEGDRYMERRIKNRGGAKLICPRCSARMGGAPYPVRYAPELSRWEPRAPAGRGRRFSTVQAVD